MMEKMRLDVLCVQKTKWREDRARMMVGGRGRNFHMRVERDEVVESALQQKRSVKRLSELKDGKDE